MTFVCRRKRSHSNYASHQVFSGLLTTLNLFNNDLHSEGGMAIAETLKVNRVLTSLNLQSNKLGPTGAAAIAEALKSGNAVLTNLNSAAIAEALKVNTTIRRS